MRKHIPNLFTLLNLFLGCIAIVLVLQPTEKMVLLQQGNLFITLPPSITLATFFMLAAGVVDFLDGWVARLLNTTSEMGKQLDSLSDVVTFGVAPSVIMYQMLQMSWLRHNDALQMSIVPLLPAFLPALAAAWRLAKFNIDERQQLSFRGVPTPITALTFAAFPWLVQANLSWLSSWVLNAWVLYGAILLLSFFMVSDIPIMALKFKRFDWAHNKLRYVFAVWGLVLIVALQWLAMPLIYVSYVLLSLLFRKQIV